VLIVIKGVLFVKVRIFVHVVTTDIIYINKNV
jgi:hypothetical protein